ncbi:uncharacterized protein MYCFIDRAFT_169388 [Pseudocercospora fijiensis CIRAD86]|uniref:26S proteasome complex subunit SEM1 n=1 Tax=Pseudocercospora fijiensis (strain CIRAD86) TaxID=383855 RepID=N1Q7H9_PSEFD|nr:uncharacterized protein MYCFIDRAFT_169388 [Pseudocercospora fijiensis CIRAD86]EME87591.1 hypothetical protein MYCFIDRAFT_169388 [Pseudocercospora fijiensis CIRAD86]
MLSKCTVLSSCLRIQATIFGDWAEHERKQHPLQYLTTTPTTPPPRHRLETMSDGSNLGATAKAGGGLANDNAKTQEKPLQPQKPAAQLEEDDEFEDFPRKLMHGVDWAKEEEVGQQAGNTHLWEESWDDDDTTDEFSTQLKEELKKMSNKKSYGDARGERGWLKRKKQPKHE